MKRILLLGFLALSQVLLVGIKQTPAQAYRGMVSPEPDLVPFCTLAANPKIYDGRLVVSEAVATSLYHSIAYYDPLCSRASGTRFSSAQATYLELNKRDTDLWKQFETLFSKYGNARVVFIGRIDSSRDAYGADGQLFQINVQSLISVYKIPNKERKLFELGNCPPEKLLNSADGKCPPA